MEENHPEEEKEKLMSEAELDDMLLDTKSKADRLEDSSLGKKGVSFNGKVNVLQTSPEKSAAGIGTSNVSQ